MEKQPNPFVEKDRKNGEEMMEKLRLAALRNEQRRCPNCGHSVSFLRMDGPTGLLNTAFIERPPDYKLRKLLCPNCGFPATSHGFSDETCVSVKADKTFVWVKY